MQTTDWGSFAVSLGAVLALLGALLFLLRRVQARGLPGLPGLSARRIRILESASLGPRQKLVLLRVREQEILVGVTAQQMTTLATFSAEPGDAAAALPANPDHARLDDPLAPLSKRMAEAMKSVRAAGKKP